MFIISAILYFLTHHFIWSFFLILFVCFAMGIILSIWRKHGIWIISLSIIGFLAATFNIFLTHYVNSLFLNAVGTESTAIVVYAEETNAMYNDQSVLEYEAVLKTTKGQDIEVKFTTMSASIYPLRNAILIPPRGETFVAKYVPGFERNILIMSDKSEYGKKWLINKDLNPVMKAEARLAANPDNPEFMKGYKRALQTFIDKHGKDDKSDIVRQYEQKLEALEASKN